MYGPPGRYQSDRFFGRELSTESNVDVFVYLIGRQDGPIKLGISSNLEKRLAGIQTGCPFEIRLLHQIKMRTRSHALNFERQLKLRWAEYRLEGEWFALSADLAIQEMVTP